MTCAPSAAARGMPLVTGGSGRGMGLPETLRAEGLLGAAAAASLREIEGRALVIAASCSAEARTRIAEVSGKWPLRNLSPERLAEGGADRNCPRGVFRSRGVCGSGHGMCSGTGSRASGSRACVPMSARVCAPFWARALVAPTPVGAQPMKSTP